MKIKCEKIFNNSIKLYEISTTALNNKKKNAQFNFILELTINEEILVTIYITIYIYIYS